MSKPVTDEHKRIAKLVADEWASTDYDDDMGEESAGLDELVAQAIADAEARGYERGVEDAADCYVEDGSIAAQGAMRFGKPASDFERSIKWSENFKYEESKER